MERYHNGQTNQRFPPPSEYDRYAVKPQYPESGQAQHHFANSQKPSIRGVHNDHSQTDGPHHYVPSRSYQHSAVSYPEDPKNYQQQFPHWEHPNSYPQHPPSYQGYREQPVSHPQQMVTNPTYHPPSKNPQEPLLHPEHAASHKRYPLNYPGQQVPQQEHLVRHEQDPRNYGKSASHPEKPGMYQDRPNTYHEPISQQGQQIMHQAHVGRFEQDLPKYQDTVNSHPEQPGMHYGRPLTYQDPPLNLNKLSLQEHPGSHRQQPSHQPEYPVNNRENPTIQQEHKKSIPEYSLSNREALGNQEHSGGYMVHPLSLKTQSGSAYRKSSWPENTQALHNSNNNTYPERSQAQRSKSHHRAESTDLDPRLHKYEEENKPLKKSPSNVREARRPILPQVEYGSRSHDTDVYAIPNRNGHQGGPDHYRVQHKAQKAKKPRIPKPDYTWHRKSLPNFDYDDSD